MKHLVIFQLRMHNYSKSQSIEQQYRVGRAISNLKVFLKEDDIIKG